MNYLILFTTLRLKNPLSLGLETVHDVHKDESSNSTALKASSFGCNMRFTCKGEQATRWETMESTSNMLWKGQ